jgi:1-aminocyclopropane-1-carboxylate deaminase/D-cysteine desulfhydrase-like pyridoxal-dependent ACC family enzyme
MTIWTPDLPRQRLFDDPSPLHRIERFAAAIGGTVDVWIKREDLLPLAFGGNKLRNLEFLVGAAMAEGADTLVTVGRRWSNHCRLTAAAGAKAGLEVHLVLSGPPTDPPNPGIVLDELLGATVHQARTADRTEREALVTQVVDELRATGRSPYVIGVGGGGTIGAAGQALAALELAMQAEAAGIRPARIVVPTATGGTQAGLVVGAGLAGQGTAVTGVLVARPEDEIRPVIEATVAGLSDLAGIAIPATAIELDASEFGDGYGRPTIAADVATRLLARSEGILVDPIYTAKALAALVAQARAGGLDGQTVVFWHAGGTPGLFEPLD